LEPFEEKRTRIMTQPIPSETIEYERYVAMERHREAYLALQYANHTNLAELKKQYLLAVDAVHSIGAQSTEGAKPSPSPKTITVHVEGGMVQDVTGIPTGYEVRVEDRDEGDTSHPSWDGEKGCFVTVYGGDNASDSPAPAPNSNAAGLDDFTAFPSEILQLAEIDADDGDLALKALSEIRVLARNTAAKVKGGPR
jgi:hypothetical protein